MTNTVDHENISLRPLRIDAARNRQRIMEAATEVFAQRGLDATLDDIARHAGVGVGTVYRRFPNKEALVGALFENAVTGIVDLAVQAANATDSWEGLVWFMEGSLQRQAEDFGLRDVVTHGQCGQERIAEARERIVLAVGQLVERAKSDGYLRADFVPADIPMIVLMVNAVAGCTRQLAPELWRRYLAMVMDGLSVGGGPPTELSAAPADEMVKGALTVYWSR